MRRALFIARLQPMHKGHEYVLKQLIKNNELIIAIGSSNKMDRNNPFSIEERKEMVKRVLCHEKKYRIIAIPDVADDRVWTRNIMKKAKFDLVVSGNPWTRKCFEGSEIKVIKPRFIKPKIYNASKIRKLIRENKGWERYVPKCIVSIIKKRYSLS